LHSVGAVQKAFAENRAPLVALEPTRVSTMLIPKTLARALGRPALARPLPQPKAPYYVIVITDRTWLRDLDRHQREAVRAVGGGNANFKKFLDAPRQRHPRLPPRATEQPRAAEGGARGCRLTCAATTTTPHTGQAHADHVGHRREQLRPCLGRPRRTRGPRRCHRSLRLARLDHRQTRQ